MARDQEHVLAELGRDRCLECCCSAVAVASGLMLSVGAGRSWGGDPPGDLLPSRVALAFLFSPKTMSTESRRSLRPWSVAPGPHDVADEEHDRAANAGWHPAEHYAPRQLGAVCEGLVGCVGQRLPRVVAPAHAEDQGQPDGRDGEQ